MKRSILVAFAVISLSGCAIRQPVLQVSSALDYSDFTKNGIFVSESNSVSFVYEPIASVSALHLSGYEVAKKGRQTFSDDAMGVKHEGAVITTNKWISASRSSVLAELCKKVHEIGANGVINLVITPQFDYSGPYIYLAGYSGSGMAIKK